MYVPPKTMSDLACHRPICSRQPHESSKRPSRSRLQHVFPPTAPHFLPTFHVFPASVLLQSQTPLNPLLATHFVQPGQCTGKGKSFLVASEDAAIFQDLHVQT